MGPHNPFRGEAVALACLEVFSWTTHASGERRWRMTAFSPACTPHRMLTSMSGTNHSTSSGTCARCGCPPSYELVKHAIQQKTTHAAGRAPCTTEAAAPHSKRYMLLRSSHCALCCRVPRSLSSKQHVATGRGGGGAPTNRRVKWSWRGRRRTRSPAAVPRTHPEHRSCVRCSMQNATHSIQPTMYSIRVGKLHFLRLRSHAVHGPCAWLSLLPLT
jgi:hypothetical protein